MYWPEGDHDIIGLWGMSSDVIRGFCESYLSDSPHTEVVFWLGSAHIWQGADLETLKTDIAALVAAIGDRPYALLGPVDAKQATAELRPAFDEVNAHLAATYAQYLNTEQVLELPERAAEYYRADGAHFTRAAYAALTPVVNATLARQREVAATGPPAAAGEPAYLASPLRQVTDTASRLAPGRWKVRLAGHDRLLVGDAMCVLWPGDDYDAIALWGQSSHVIYERAAEPLRMQPYEEVVIWLGTTHLLHGRPAEELEHDIEALLQLVGDRPHVLLGPLAPRHASEALRAPYDALNAHLAAASPHFLDPAAVLGIPGDGDRYYAGSVHLGSEGYAVLQAAVDRHLELARVAYEARRRRERRGLSAALGWPEMRPGEERRKPLRKIDVQGRSRIVVGDSLSYLWPGTTHDAIGLWGISSEAIRAEAEPHLRAGTHAEVILWVGTAHLLNGDSRRSLQRDIAALVEAVGERPYVLIGPVAPRGRGKRLEKQYAKVNAYLARTYPYYVDPAAALGLSAAGRRHYRRDRIHLRVSAYRVLQPMVEDVLRRARADLDRTAVATAEP